MPPHSIPEDSANLQAQLLEQSPVDRWPTITSLKLTPPPVEPRFVKNSETVEAIVRLQVGNDLVWFDGHFPDQPVLPGVVQVHWAGVIASHVFAVPVVSERLTRLKFKSPVLPDQTLELTLALNRKKGLVSFNYRFDATEFSSGTFNV